MNSDDTPMLWCRSGCGFFGNPAQDNLCSICYKAKKDHPTVISEQCASVGLPTVSEERSEGDRQDSKNKKARCAVCRKRVGLTAFECRCTGVFCGLHRYSDTHDCTFDYREQGAQEIRRNNPVVSRSKIQKI